MFSTLVMCSSLFFLFLCLHISTSNAKNLPTKRHAAFKNKTKNNKINNIDSNTNNKNNNNIDNKINNFNNIFPRNISLRDSRPMPNGPISLERGTQDRIFDYGCFWASRVTNDGDACKCKKDFTTIMSQSGDNWNCATNAELDCEHSIGDESDRDVYIIKEGNFLLLLLIVDA